PTNECGGGESRAGGRGRGGGFAPTVPSCDAQAGRARQGSSARTRAASHAGAGRPRPLNPPTAMTFAWSGVSGGSSLHLGLILLAGVSLLLLANRIAGGRFIRRGPLSVGRALPFRAVSHLLNYRGPFLERVLILGTSPLAGKLIEEIEAQPRRRSTIVGVVDDGMGFRQPPFLYFLEGREQLGKIVDLVRPHRIIV